MIDESVSFIFIEIGALQHTKSLIKIEIEIVNENDYPFWAKQI